MPAVSPTRQQILSPSLALYLVPNILFLLALSYIPLPNGMPTHTVLASTLSRLTVSGTVILGLLSGFGAIYTAWDFFPVFSRSAKCAYMLLARLSRQLTKPGIGRSLRTTKFVLLKGDCGAYRRTSSNDRRTFRRSNLRTSVPLVPSRNALSYARISSPRAKPAGYLETFRACRETTVFGIPSSVPQITDGRSVAESTSLAQEITGLQALEDDMSRNVEVLKQRQADAKFSRTLAGQAFNWGGRLFAVYCIYRILAVRPPISRPVASHSLTSVLQCLLNLVLPRAPPSAPGESSTTNADIVSFVLAYLLSYLPFIHLPQDKISVISRQISLGLVGAIILSSIRRVLRGVSRVCLVHCVSLVGGRLTSLMYSSCE